MDNNHRDRLDEERAAGEGMGTVFPVSYKELNANQSEHPSYSEPQGRENQQSGSGTSGHYRMM